MGILLIIAAVSLILGVLFLTNAKSLDNLSNLMNKVIIKSGNINEKQSKILGVFLIIFAVILFFIAMKLR